MKKIRIYIADAVFGVLNKAIVKTGVFVIRAWAFCVNDRFICDLCNKRICLCKKGK